MINKSEEVDVGTQRPAPTASNTLKAEKKNNKLASENKNAKTSNKEVDQQQHQAQKLDSNMSKGCGPNQVAKLGASLQSASREGKLELVRLLLRCGADVNAQDQEFGNTALHLAAWNGFSETVQVLCRHRANTSIRNKAHFTALHMACQQGHNQSARLLLMAGAKTEAKNSYGDTPLHTAARYGHAGVARILLSARSNPNQVNKNHDTPLHIAAAMGRRKLTKIFMQNGAEPAIKNKQNETAMDIALRKDLIDIQELIANPPPAGSRSSGRPRPAHARGSRSARPRHDSCERPVRHRRGLELAVDVPEGCGRRPSPALSPLTLSAGRHRQPRPRTLASGAAELHLLRAAKQQASCSNLELANSPSPAGARNVLAPDARATDWAEIMERSARSFEAKTLDAAAAARTRSPEPARRRKCSPTNSVRSSLASRRLVLGPRLRQRGAWNQSKSSLLVRRPNLGTCVGKLSLLRLRNLVASRTTLSNNELSKSPQEDDGEPSRPALGRRQERLDRLQREQSAGRRALNGIRLSTTRPLAALEDETQLYAIPKKAGPKAKQQQTNTGNNSTNGSEKAKEAIGGPALTSDNCHSSLSSLNRAATPLSSIVSSTEETAGARSCEEPAVVGVHTSEHPSETQPDLGAPGYSAIGDGSQHQPAQVGCNCDQEEEEEEEGAKLAAKSAASKLRQLFQFNNGASNGCKPKVAASAIAGGYYAYSPVVQSSSELRRWQQQQQQQHQRQQAKLEVNNSSQANESNKKLAAAVNGKRCSWLKSKFISTSKSNLVSGEPVSETNKPANKEDESLQGSSSALVGPERQAELIRINEAPEDGQENQIRPRGSLSVASAELIAAQKSLAAAAAAKVKRTRLSRAELGAFREEAEEEEQEEDGDDAGEETANARGHLQSQVGMLTVKTSDEFNIHRHWPQATHQTGQKYLMIGRNGLPMDGLSHHQLGNDHRNGSGGNSVGMSDSSPSNNGADSDNSMQTATTGSLNADNTLATTVNNSQALANGQQPNSSPLGILSRILLNNNKNYATAARKSQDQSQNTNSSPSLSSPAGSQSTKAPAKLDQLGSRSRCPIVVASKPGEQLPSPPPPPPLPAKSVLKPAGSFQTPPLRVAPSKAESGLVESMNGLPRVASYSQISSVAPHLEQLSHYRPPSHLASPYTTANYLPYAPQLGRYSQPVDNLKYLGLQRHHLSHHDLSSGLFESGAMPPTAAINYEYYLEAPLAGSYANHQRYHYMPPGAADHLYGAPQATYDDSIYIPAAYKHHYQLEIPPGSHPMTQYQQQPRPKSSLDNFHLSRQPSQTTLQETTNGLQRQISATIDHKQQTNGKMPAAYYSYSSSPYNPPHQHQHQHQPTADSYLYTSENSIYASDRTLAATFHTTTPGSQLTVLPTCDELPYDRGQSSSTASSASPMKQLGAVGGADGCPGVGDGSLHNGASPSSTDSHQQQRQQHDEGSSSSSPASTSSAVSSLLSSPAQRPSTDAAGPPTPMARQQQEQQRNSWTPTASAPFKSLVQINQPASSCDSAAVAQQAKSHQSSQSATTTAVATTSKCDFNSPAAMTDLPQQVASSVNGRSHLQLNGQSSAVASKQTKVVISNGTNGNNYMQSSPTTITANNCQPSEHCNGSTTTNNKTVL